MTKILILAAMGMIVSFIAGYWVANRINDAIDDAMDDYDWNRP